MVEDSAILLRLWEFAEKDSIAAVLTRSHGKVRLLAKGARRQGGKLGGILTPFSRIWLQFTEPHGDRLSRLCGASLERGFTPGTSGLGGFYLLSYAAELLLHAEVDPSTGGTLFRLLDALADRAGQGRSELADLVYLQYWFLRLEGVAPDPGVCFDCRRPLGAGELPAALEPVHMASLCSGCAVLRAGTPNLGSGEDAATLLLARHLSPADFPSSLPGPEALPGLARFLETHIGTLTGHGSRCLDEALRYLSDQA